MSLSVGLKPLQKTLLSWKPPDSFARRSSSRYCHGSSQNAFLGLSATNRLQATRDKTSTKRSKTVNDRSKKLDSNCTANEKNHRLIGTARSLFTNDSSSPGTPFFLPDGTHMLQKLTSFLRAQYPNYGFHEVLTPTLFKETLWRQSGHWENYKDDMFTVSTTRRPEKSTAPVSFMEGEMHPPTQIEEPQDSEVFGLKPMNCPGHCILFQSKRRSYKELPIRYAEFSPLHRNEISGALSGLTRVRRFHQDDGHIFCRPSQVMNEVLNSIEQINIVYRALQFKDEDLLFVLSTRPEKDYIGTLEEWDMAEAQLKEALNSYDKDGKSRIRWKTNQGDGAFYGPKIDVILRDSDGKQHQTATIQLDFQLPKRFGLEYEAPAPELEAKGLTTNDPKLRETIGRVAPVMIHRAILGSLERFIALLLEKEDGRLAFWLSPRQVIILTVTDKTSVVEHARAAREYISNMQKRASGRPRALDEPTYVVDIDDSGDSIAQKVMRAKKSKYNLICVMGMKNIRGAREKLHATMDVEVNRGMQPNLVSTWDLIESIQRGSQAPQQRDRGVGGVSDGNGVRLGVDKVKALVTQLCQEYL